MLDSFEDDGPVPVFSQMRDFIPGVRSTGENVADPFFGGEGDIGFDRFAVFGFELLAEDGVGKAGAVPSTGHKGDVTSVLS